MYDTKLNIAKIIMLSLSEFRHGGAIVCEAQTSIISGTQCESGLPHQRCRASKSEHEDLRFAGGIYSGVLNQTD